MSSEFREIVVAGTNDGSVKSKADISYRCAEAQERALESHSLPCTPVRPHRDCRDHDEDENTGGTATASCNQSPCSADGFHSGDR